MDEIRDIYTQVMADNGMFPIFIHHPHKQTSKPMTEQSLIEYAKAGDTGAIDYLAANGFEGVIWELAITHVNGGWLPGHEIKRVWDEMVNIHKTTAMSFEEVRDKLQEALNNHHYRAPKLIAANLAMASPAGRPWHFTQQHSLKWGQRGGKFTPPKKKRK